MKKFIVSFIVWSFVLGLLGSVNAALIVDTGATPYGGGWDLKADQWLSAEFTMNQADILTSVEAYFFGTYTEGAVTAAIYTDGADVPGLELYSGDFTPSKAFQNYWNGLYDLSWDLAAGTYWLSFEIRAGEYYGSLPGTAINELSNYGSTACGLSHCWRSSDYLDLGIRISSDPPSVPVPEPAAFFLFGTGLAGLVGFICMRKKVSFESEPDAK